VNSNRNWEKFMEVFSPEFMSALLAIVVIDLVLAGDNAIVIALAARNVPKHLQKRAIIWGTVGAIAVRSSLTMVVVWLLKVPGLMLAGGAMLIWIAYRLLVPANEGGEHNVAPASTFWGAMKTIIVADALMGLDNVLAVAGAAHGSFLLVVLGLLISIPIVIWGSQLILKYVERFPAIIYFGAGVLAWTAAKMMLGEPLLKETLQSNALIAPLTYVAVIGAVLWYGFRGNHRRLENSIAEKLAALPAVQKADSSTAVAETGGKTMKRILLPIDASSNSLKAVQHVMGRFVTDPDMELHLLHVCTPFSRHIARFVSRRNLAGYHRDEAAKAMAAARLMLDARGIPYASHVEIGDRAEIITATARRIRASQIVIGTARKNSLTRMIEDSVTNQVLEQTDVPVEVIAGEAVPRIERVGVPASIGAMLAALVLALD
jgi:YjbE family integral membrane protein